MSHFEDVDAAADAAETAKLYAERIIAALANELDSEATETQIVHALVALMGEVPDRALLHVFVALERGDRLFDAFVSNEHTVDVIHNFGHDMSRRLVLGEETESRLNLKFDSPDMATLVLRGLRGLEYQRFEEREREAENALERIASARWLLADVSLPAAPSNLSDPEIVRMIEELIADIPAEDAVLAKVHWWVNSQLLYVTGYSKDVRRQYEQEILAGYMAKYGAPERGPRIAQNAERLAGVPPERIAAILVERIRPTNEVREGETVASPSAFQRCAECWQAYFDAAQVGPDQLRAAFRHRDDSALLGSFREVLVGGMFRSLAAAVHEAEVLAESTLFGEILKNRGFASPEMQGVRDVVRAAGRHVLQNAKEYGLLPAASLPLDVDPGRPSPPSSLSSSPGATPERQYGEVVEGQVDPAGLPTPAQPPTVVPPASVAPASTPPAPASSAPDVTQRAGVPEVQTPLAGSPSHATPDSRAVAAPPVQRVNPPTRATTPVVPPSAKVQAPTPQGSLPTVTPASEIETNAPVPRPPARDATTPSAMPPRTSSQPRLASTVVPPDPPSNPVAGSARARPTPPAPPPASGATAESPKGTSGARARPASRRDTPATPDANAATPAPTRRPSPSGRETVGRFPQVPERLPTATPDPALRLPPLPGTPNPGL